MPNWKKVITSGSDATLNSLIVTSGVTGSLFGTSSYAVTASYAENGGVTQIIAGTNVSIFPTNGKGIVTISATAVNGSAGSSVTASFTNLSTWNFNHALGNRNVLIQVYDSIYNQIIPQTINLVDDNNATITFPTSETGFAIASLGGTPASASYTTTASYAITASYALNANINVDTGSLLVTASILNNTITFTKGDSSTFDITVNTGSFVSASYAVTSSYAVSAISSSYAVTASYAANVPTGNTVTASFSNLSTWNFNHGLNNRHVIVQAYDTEYNQIAPATINLTDSNNVTISFPTNESGFAIAMRFA